MYHLTYLSFAVELFYIQEIWFLFTQNRYNLHYYWPF